MAKKNNENRWRQEIDPMVFSAIIIVFILGILFVGAVMAANYEQRINRIESIYQQIILRNSEVISQLADKANR